MRSQPAPAAGARLDGGIEVDSDAEQAFITWLDQRAPTVAAWLVPQAPFDDLLVAFGGRSTKCRRIDFLIAPPGELPIAVEIDGSQHANQVLRDVQRDALLKGIGIITHRIPSSEVSAGRGPNLEQLLNRLRKFGSAPYDPLRWEAIQLHRFMEALIEAAAHGLVAGPAWSIELHDPTGSVIDLVEPYLELIWAVDRLWDGGLAPSSVTIVDGGRGECVRFDIDDQGAVHRRSTTQRPFIDVRVRLELDRTPAHRLPRLDDTPTIVVRSCVVPARIAETVIDAGERAHIAPGAATTSTALRMILEAVFAKTSFRDGQEQAITEVLEGRDCVVLLPTGAGKSLVYQMAGLCLPGRTIVVDPLVALIEDQEAGLRCHGIDRVVGLSSQSASRDGAADALRAIADAEAYFILVSPERLQIPRFRDALRELAGTATVNLAVIDEAHVISEWGHQFRTAYLNIGRVLRERCADRGGAPPPLLALTGTASRAVLRDVLFLLDVEIGPSTLVRPQSFDRPELTFDIRRCAEEDAESELKSVVKHLPAAFGESRQTFFHPVGRDTYSGIVFVPTVNGKHGINQTAGAIADVCPSVTVFSGSAPSGTHPSTWEAEKRANARAFKDNQMTALVSTNAFGMGIDKSNIRWVVHYGLPGSIESYYQEVGRAGRDRRPAHCCLILSQYDEARSRRLLGEALSLEEARDGQRNTPRGTNDIVTTALYFHVNSFPGIDAEEASIAQVAEMLDLRDEASTVDLPFDEDHSSQERALHRLFLLGCIRDYTVDWGGGSFTVETRAVTPDSVTRSLLDFVGRSQPGRLAAVTSRVGRESFVKVHDAVEFCGRVLAEFVYDTVERSRRRSMREMWLAAMECTTSEQLRRRVLDFLTEGDIAPVLEKLVERPIFSFADWLDTWGALTAADAHELRGASARLLASFPDHPGLLASRGLAEALDASGDLRELDRNLADAARSAMGRYGSEPGQLDDTLGWLRHWADTARPGVQAAIAGSFASAGHVSPLLMSWLEDLAALGDATAATVYLSLALERANVVAAGAVDRYKEY